jgi:hypothetical protein
VPRNSCDIIFFLNDHASYDSSICSKKAIIGALEDHLPTVRQLAVASSGAFDTVVWLFGKIAAMAASASASRCVSQARRAPRAASAAAARLGRAA